jgi:hypothetical protein
MENNALIFATGNKNADFVVYNPYELELTDETPVYSPIVLKDSALWDEIRSQIWSANCRFFFFICRNGILIGDNQDNSGVLCKNLSRHVFDEYLKAFSKQTKSTI